MQVHGVIVVTLCLRGTDDTDLLPDSDVARVEEALEVAEEDGIALEPFNLKRERAEGHFDESGHYVEHNQDDAANRDAWLDSSAASLHPIICHVLEKE